MHVGPLDAVSRVGTEQSRRSSIMFVDVAVVIIVVVIAVAVVVIVVAVVVVVVEVKEVAVQSVLRNIVILIHFIATVLLSTLLGQP